MVNGQVKNVYSSYDRILYLYEMSKFQGFPIGRYPIIIPAAGEDHSEYSEIGRKDTVNNEDEEQYGKERSRIFDQDFTAPRRLSGIVVSRLPDELVDCDDDARNQR